MSTQRFKVYLSHGVPVADFGSGAFPVANLITWDRPVVTKALMLGTGPDRRLMRVFKGRSEKGLFRIRVSGDLVDENGADRRVMLFEASRKQGPFTVRFFERDREARTDTAIHWGLALKVPEWTLCLVSSDGREVDVSQALAFDNGRLQSVGGSRNTGSILLGGPATERLLVRRSRGPDGGPPFIVLRRVVGPKASSTVLPLSVAFGDQGNFRELEAQVPSTNGSLSHLEFYGRA